MSVSPALARELAAARPRFNAQIAAARRARTGFDTDALSDAVRTRIDPLAEAVERVAPDRTAAVVDAAFALTVRLVEHGLSGERRALVDSAWRDTAVPLATVVAEAPDTALAMLTNGVLKLGATPGARPGEWLERMAALAPLVTAETLAAAGQVAAWRVGMSHYRQGALAAAANLPEPLALAAVGAEGAWPEVAAALVADRWWTPDVSASLGVTFGGFSGFGGPFAEPPEVRASDVGFVTRAGDRYGLLVADAWGATLHPADAAEFESAAEPQSPSPALREQVATHGLPFDDAYVATTADSIAVASPFSHRLLVLPWRG